MVAPEVEELRTRVDELRVSLGRLMNYYLLRRRAELRDLTESRGFAETAGAVLALSARRCELEARAASALKANLQRARLRFSEARRRLSSADFRAPLAVTATRLESLTYQITQAARLCLERKQHRLAMTLSKLDLLSPLAVLGRGYVLVKDEYGHLVPRAAALSPGQNLTLRFEDGEAHCRVVENLESPTRLP
jgi:exodeoxyribonuclease VII large subunit